MSKRFTRRWIVMVVALCLLVPLGPVTAAPAAAAGGPSVPLPPTNSVPASAQSMTPRGQDEASRSVLRGDQPTGSTTPAGGGTAAATTLSPSALWEVAEQTGDFTWSYPLRVPPVPGGLAPKLALSYSSSVVDGRTSTTNNQASWVGDGWDLGMGFVERVYGSCASDKEGSNTGQNVGDLCWKSDNAIASYANGGGQLILGANGWRAKNDDGSRIERIGGAGNGDDNGEHWKITTVEGTQYFFGSRPEARSTWTVPVFGDDSGEPCHNPSGFAASSCTQAWRWNLDKVVDRHGNMMLLSYAPETNKYGKNAQDAAVEYIRGGTLTQIDYGLHRDLPGQAAARVVFATADRCVPGSTCTFDKPDNWPDTALKDRCDGATCPEKHVPTFWSTKRLAGITTEVLRGGSHAGVDRWTLDQQFPDPGGSGQGGKERAALWLKSITHTGLVGDDITLPPVTFEGAKYPNRVKVLDGAGPLIRFRITGIVSESGGVTSIGYSSDCTPESLPANAETNTRQCFPVRWNKPGYKEVTDWFHKYVVTQVTQSDRISANPEQVKTYEYLDGAGWHYDTSEFTPNDKKTWNEYRGYARVRIRTGDGYDLAGPVTMTEQRFYRGMNGDRLNPAGGTKTVQVEDSERVRRDDHDWLGGTELETIEYDGARPDAAVVSKTINHPHWHGPTASRGSFHAYRVRPGIERTYTTLESGRRITETETTYDEYGLPRTVDDQGDTSTDADDRCTTTTYARNTGAWLVAFTSRVETVAARCGTTPSFPADAVTDIRVGFDGRQPGEAPTVGNVTLDERIEQRPASGPVYSPRARFSYDQHGRVTAQTDALDHTIQTAYTPATGGPLTSVTKTNELNHTGTTTLDPAWGTPTASVDANNRKTEIAYDALGRTIEVWRPNRIRPPGTFGNGSARYSYLIRNDDTTVVTATSLGPNGRYTSSNTLYDGLYRVRQVQQPAVGGGRLITDTRYDTQGRVWKQTRPYYNDGAVDTTLWRANDNAVPGLTTTEYDGAGRPVESIFIGGGEEKWRTSTRYGGDRVHSDPPDGGVATTAIADARGLVTALRQYHSGQPSGTYDETTYGYAPSGHLVAMTDPAGSTWRFKHDLQGRQIEVYDPDKGTTVTSYDAAGRPLTQTDARGVTLAYDYDVLGRRTGIYRDRVGGTRLASWTYDTAAGGKGGMASSTRWLNGSAYTSKVTAYSPLYQPVTMSVVIPEAAGALAGTYTSIKKYNLDGSPKGESFGAVGGLPEESINYTYDDAGLPQATTGGFDGTTVTYAGQTLYTRYGEAQRIELGEGTKRAWLSFYYDDYTRRLKRYIVDAEVPRPMVADVNYRYDAAGNVLSIADTTLEQPADTQCFRYDYLQRMTEAWTPAGDCAAEPSTDALAGPAPYWQSFRYDKVGNRTTEVQHTTGGDVTRSYHYPAPGSQVRPHAVISVESSSGAVDEFGYDAAGNTTSRKVAGSTQTLEWTAEGQLGSVTEGLKKTDFVYDAQGARLLRNDPTGTTLYLGNQELRLDKATGQVVGTRYYAHGGKVVAVRIGRDRLDWLAGDHQGTQQIAINSDRLSVVQRRQTPFGGSRGGSVAFPGERGFVGGAVDGSTGLVHLGAREYDPATGRFISVDPVLDTKNPQQFNAYAYANNSPVTFSDPTGLIFGFADMVKALLDIMEEMRIAMQRSRSGSSDKTLRHNAVVRQAANVIRLQGPAKIKGFDPKYLKTEVLIPKGSKNTPGNDGHADILYDDGVNVYIWEVKSEYSYTPAQVQAEVDHYVKHYKAAYPSKQVQTGWDLGVTWSFPYKNSAGRDEVVTVKPGGRDSKGAYPGAILYNYREKEEEKKKQPDPPIIPAPQAEPKKEPPANIPGDIMQCAYAPQSCETVPGNYGLRPKPVEGPAEVPVPLLVGAGAIAVGAAALASPVIAVGAGIGGLLGLAFG